MNELRIRLHRSVLGGAAAAAATLALALMLDAGFAPAEPHRAVHAAPAHGARAATEVAIVPARIEVVGERTAPTAVSDARTLPRG